MRVVVFGGSSRLGRQVWRKALDAGHRVTVYDRWAKERAKEEPALRAYQGDLIDAGRIRGAVSDQDAVIICLGTDLINGVTPLTGTTRIVEAMDRHDVQRLVVATATGDGLDEKKISIWARIFMPWVRLWGYRWGTHMLGGHEPQESHVKGSSLDWTIVRVPVVNDKLAPGFTERTTNISREDAATFLVRQLDDASSIHKTLTARGSQSPTAPDRSPPTDVAPPQEPPAKGKFDDYPLGSGTEP
ncbi:MAG: NAD(P)H-binding protein [Acidimicrobiaceae bacterium]|nr:NAD(P)H-binding protein [Acidimicrobiaceae bacterium]MXW76321.1 NAD(P)H-binding protein [Acidimicrobiaceae bacterium]MYA75690.1 NAD(P)H-binding protein [Acidimicrobiaceae bacterium]MYC42957.1 NAD(P)H-binding protein [Acidimicrobiaceae bacterium]MYD07499.1 NAD(P)H-binding protein [Acidimicrobiaceae bacterium]